MCPRFKGGSEDWLDDEVSRKKSDRKRSPKKTLATATAPAAKAGAKPLPNATVMEVFPKLCRVLFDSGEERLCTYRRAQVWRKPGAGSETQIRERAPVAVGDRVVARLLGTQDGVIEACTERTNCLARPAPDRYETTIQVIAANVDCLAIVCSVRNPDFSVGIVDRFLIAAQAQGIEAILVLTKQDLLEPRTPEESAPEWELYSTVGVDHFSVSVQSGQGIEELRKRIQGKRTVFCGHSGVGKSSLLTALLGHELRKAGEVSAVTGKGKHTTSSAILIPHEGSEWIDTPGVREFGLIGINPGDLRNYYMEFIDTACSKRGCLHREEEDCEARSLPRYLSYRRILESLIEG